MITFGINGNEANANYRVGVGRYAFELINHLTKLPVPDTRFQIYLSRPPLPDFPPPSERVSYKVFGPSKLWTLTGLQSRLLKEKLIGAAPNIFFTPTHYTPVLMPLPSVVSIMEMSFERFPEYFKKKDYYQLKYWTKASVLQASKIITISNFSKKEILHYYHLPDDKVVVTYPGFDALHFHTGLTKEKLKIAAVQKKYHVSSPYITFLGTLQPRKNLVRLIEAFAGLSTRDLKLVVVGMINEGRGGWLYDAVFNAVAKHNLKDRVIFTGFVPDSEVVYLLAGSTGFVYPSIYEGFGIPAVEAMALGIPVVVPKTSCFPEVCGQAPIYINDPLDTSSIRDALKKLVSLTPAERSKRIDLGLTWVKRYNWTDTAKRTLKVLSELAHV